MGKRSAWAAGCSVYTEKTYPLGGYPQKVLFEGKQKDSPIVLFLHGGPGSPLPFCAGCRGMFPELTGRVILALWDQLGCGLNDYPIDNSFTIEQFITMTLDLIRAIRRDFPNNPLCLFGVSWGSILAAEAAARLPEEIDRVVVYGQVTRDLFFNREVFAALDAAPLKPKARKQLDALRARTAWTAEDIRPMAGLIRRYTEGYTAKNGGQLPMGKMILGILTSPDYTVKNFGAIMVNGTIKNRSLYTELLGIDLRATLAGMRVPYLILQGSTDIVTSTEQIRALLASTNNPNLHFRLIPDSGHIPGAHAMAAIIEQDFRFFTDASIRRASP